MNTPTPFPFNKALVAALDSPRYSGTEHRIAFSDESNGVDGYVYAKTLKLALQRAEYVTIAINGHDALVASIARKDSALRQAQQIIAHFEREISVRNGAAIGPRFKFSPTLETICVNAREVEADIRAALEGAK